MVAEADAAALAASGGTTFGATTGLAFATGAGGSGSATGAAFRKSSPREASISATNSPRTGAVCPAATQARACAAGACAGTAGLAAGRAAGGATGLATVPGRKLSPNEASRSETNSFRAARRAGSGSGAASANRRAHWLRARNPGGFGRPSGISSAAGSVDARELPRPRLRRSEDRRR